MKVDEAKTIIKHYDGCFIGHSSDEVNEALEMAIASLEAWEKVKADIIAESDNKSNNMQFNLGLLAALAIINGHFKEVRNGQTK